MMGFDCRSELNVLGKLFMSKNIRKFSDDEISSGLKNGTFREHGLQIRHAELGYVVKVLKNPQSSSNSIPSTVFQINNTVIYSADIAPVLRAIAEARSAQIFEDLEERYGLVLDSLDIYNSYGSGLENLQKNCMESSVVFDNKIRRALSEVKIATVESVDHNLLVGAINAYLKIIFVYIVSTYLVHREKFGADKVILDKLNSLELSVRNIYEQLLAESWQKSDGVSLKMDGSLYAMYIFNGEYDMRELDRIVAHDSRFTSAIDVFCFFKKFHSVLGAPDYQFRNGGVRNMSWTINGLNIPKNSKRAGLFSDLLLVLEDINRLRTIREEMIQVKDIGDEYMIMLREQGSFGLREPD